MPLPAVTRLDPEVEGEGSIDPLGLAAVADRLAEAIVPGVTSRMSRPRLLTLLTLGSAVTDGLPERGKDGTPAYIVFEWLALLAFASMEDQIGLHRVQGILKAKVVQRDGVPMSPRRYLKAPTAFGVHAAYKRLGRALGTIDDDLKCRVEGQNLLSVWEREQGLDGFLNGPASTIGGKLREKLRDLIVAGMNDGYAACPRGPVLDLFHKSLHPVRIGRMEGERLRCLLAEPSGKTRGELFSLLDRPDVRAAGQDVPEAPFLRFLQPLASSDLAAGLRAIDAFERAARPIQDAFDWIRHISTKNPRVPATAAAFAQQAPNFAPDLRSRLQGACDGVRGTSSQADVESLARDFDSVIDPPGLFAAVLKRHQDVPGGRCGARRAGG